MLYTPVSYIEHFIAGGFYVSPQYCENYRQMWLSFVNKDKDLIPKDPYAGDPYAGALTEELLKRNG